MTYRLDTCDLSIQTEVAKTLIYSIYEVLVVQRVGSYALPVRVCVCVFSGYCGFIAYSKNISVSVTENAQFSISVDVNGCYSICDV